MPIGLYPSGNHCIDDGDQEGEQPSLESLAHWPVHESHREPNDEQNPHVIRLDEEHEEV